MAFGVDILFGIGTKGADKVKKDAVDIGKSWQMTAQGIDAAMRIAGRALKAASKAAEELFGESKAAVEFANNFKKNYLDVWADAIAQNERVRYMFEELNRVFTEMAPSIEELQPLISNLITGMVGISDAALRTVESIASATASVTSFLIEADTAIIKILIWPFEKMQEVVSKIVDRFGSLMPDFVKQFAEAVGVTIETIKDAPTAALGGIRDVSKATAEYAGKAAGGLEEIAHGMDKIDAGAYKATNQIQKATKASINWTKVWNDYDKELDKFFEEQRLEGLASMVDDFNEWAQSGELQDQLGRTFNTVQDRMAGALGGLQAKVSEAAGAAQQQAGKFSAGAQMALDAGIGIYQAIVDGIMQAISDPAAFKAMADSFIKFMTDVLGNPATITNAINAFIKFMLTIIDIATQPGFLSGIITAVLNGTIAVIMGLLSRIDEIINAVVNAIMTALPLLLQALMNPDFIGAILKATLDVAVAMFEFLTFKAPALAWALLEAIFNGVIGLVKKFFSVDMFKAIVHGIKDAFKKVIDWLKNVLNPAKWFKKAGSAIKRAFTKPRSTHDWWQQGMDAARAVIKAAEEGSEEAQAIISSATWQKLYPLLQDEKGTRGNWGWFESRAKELGLEYKHAGGPIGFGTGRNIPMIGQSGEAVVPIAPRSYQGLSTDGRGNIVGGNTIVINISALDSQSVADWLRRGGATAINDFIARGMTDTRGRKLAMAR